MTNEEAMYLQWHLWITEAAVEEQRRRVHREFAEYSRLLACQHRLEQELWQQSLPSWLQNSDTGVSMLKH
ncbi:hypothetical protein [Pseudomonas oryzihabitans]|uniref:Uncharacterized protein n=1 Tax=Pseudomonas oryzihabitans TaxID=47885 RepID=A0AAJ2EVG1_9PSED|nr:hypothetical protein [Pseudomonas psychrotolerans]MDR6233652.1 hypothetical protein [Pseudomonas psychrotolerans]MDR6357290.1 hypothetical protein [Pseudomonas psychrotolerans]